MFKHQTHPTAEAKAENDKNPSSEGSDKKIGAKTAVSEEPKDVSPQALRELLERNLKWSQIIYEQNRRINHKLLWSATASWFRFLIIAIPLILGIIFLPPLLKQLLERYRNLLGGVKSGTVAPVQAPSSIEDILKLLPINSAQREQLKTMLK